MFDTNDISIEISKRTDGQIDVALFKFEDKRRVKVNLKSLDSDERKVITRDYYHLFVQGSKKFAEISSF